MITACQKDEKTLFRMMMDRKIGKVYLALMPRDALFPNRYRIHDSLSYTSKAVVSSSGKEAKSVFIKHGSYGAVVGYSVVLLTGRRHQIRSHASTYLSPIIGDQLYGASDTVRNQPLALFAVGLNFRYGEKKRIRWAGAQDAIEAVTRKKKV